VAARQASLLASNKPLLLFFVFLSQNINAMRLDQKLIAYSKAKLKVMAINHLLVSDHYE